MNEEERLEELFELIEELIELNERLPVIVEGVKDRKTLRAIGLRGDIITINRGNSIFNECEQIARKHPEVIILTDWDRKGGKLKYLLTDGFKNNEVKCNTDIRGRLAKLVKKDVKDVEGLRVLLERCILLRNKHRKDWYAKRTARK